MKKLFVEYEEALALKELGFDEPCFAYFRDKKISGVNKFDRKDFEFHVISKKDITAIINEIVLAPLYSQAFEFFRDNYKLSCCLELTDKSRHYYYDFTIYDSEDRDYNDEDCFDSCKRIYGHGKYGTHNEAELECLKKLIGIVKENLPG
jgi:hypothetical protein